MPPLNNFQKKCIALAVSQALVISAAEAAVITVNGTDPTTECTLLNAIISANNDAAKGQCAAGSGADVIRIHSQTINIDSANYASPLGDSAFYIGSDITIEGKPIGSGGETSGGLIKNSGINDFRLFEVQPGRSLTLNDVAVAGGQLAGNNENGGAIYVNNGTLTLNNSAFTDNRVAAGSGADPKASGGAVFANGVNAQVNLSYSLIRSNTAQNGGAIALAAGASLAVYRSALYNNTATDKGGFAHTLEGSGVTLTESTVSANNAGSGGAIYLGDDGGEGKTQLVVQGGEFTSNRASGVGGAIATKYGDVSINDTTFAYNQASSLGGAVFMGFQNGSLEVVGSSFVSNRVVEGGEGSSTPAGGGGAIAILADNKNHKITNSTISRNVAASGGAILASTGSLSLTNTTLIGGEGVPATSNSAAAILYAGGEATVTFNNSVAAFGGEGFNYGGEYGAVARDSISILPGRVLCTSNDGATITSENANHFQDASCGQASNGDPRIGRLRYSTADNLNFSVGTDSDSNTLRNVRVSNTRYHTPVFNSPLINMGNTTICGGEQTNGVDQRGLPRGIADCDIGATESSEVSLVVNTTSDDFNSVAANCSLRDALILAGGESSSGGGLVLKSVGGEFSPRPNATCLGRADITTIQFDPTVFPASERTTITLTDYLPNISSAVSIQGPSSQALTISAGGEGRVLRANRAHLYLSDLTLANGSAYSGGGLNVYSSRLELNSVVITGNQGRRVGGASLYATEFTIDKTTISGNAAAGGNSGGVGGLRIRGIGVGVLSNSTVSGNTASDTRVGDLSVYQVGEQAGGVLIQDGHLTVIRNSTISGNSSSRTGGGIGVENASLFLVNSTISNNVADVYGGGIHVQQRIRESSNYNYESFPALINSIISGNRKGTGAAGAALPLYGSDFSIVSFNLDRGVLSKGDQVGSYIAASIFGDSSLTYNESIYSNGDSITSGGSESSTFRNSVIATSLDGLGNINSTATALNRILQPLRNNGGPTLTHDLVDRSPAIDGGEESFCSSGDFFVPISKDQRDIFRSDGACDIGSVEYVESSCYVIPTGNSKVVAFCL